MLQAAADLPQVTRVPAPWRLTGTGWIALLRMPRSATARRAFVPAALSASVAGPVSLLVCVDYLQAPCGPYREVLFVPGTMRFGDGRRRLSISRILVSTWESVVNGRANWGIPKDRADFDLERRAGIDTFRVSSEGRDVCAFDFARPTGPRLPLNTALVPARWRTLAQCYEGRRFVYRPEARGTVRLARLLDWRCNPELFPDLSVAQPLLALAVEEFEMVFPVAQVDPAAAGFC